jgi:hypothetical protein
MGVDCGDRVSLLIVIGIVLVVALHLAILTIAVYQLIKAIKEARIARQELLDTIAESEVWIKDAIEKLDGK